MGSSIIYKQRYTTECRCLDIDNVKSYDLFGGGIFIETGSSYEFLIDGEIKYVFVADNNRKHVIVGKTYYMFYTKDKNIYISSYNTTTDETQDWSVLSEISCYNDEDIQVSHNSVLNKFLITWVSEQKAIHEVIIKNNVLVETYIPQNGDVIVKGEISYIYKDGEWKNETNTYEPVSGDVLSSTSLKITFTSDGTKWYRLNYALVEQKKINYNNDENDNHYTATLTLYSDTKTGVISDNIPTTYDKYYYFILNDEVISEGYNQIDLSQYMISTKSFDIYGIVELKQNNIIKKKLYTNLCSFRGNDVNLNLTCTPRTERDEDFYTCYFSIDARVGYQNQLQTQITYAFKIDGNTVKYTKVGNEYELNYQFKYDVSYDVQVLVVEFNNKPSSAQCHNTIRLWKTTPPVLSLYKTEEYVPFDQSVETETLVCSFYAFGPVTAYDEDQEYYYTVKNTVVTCAGMTKKTDIDGETYWFVDSTSAGVTKELVVTSVIEENGCVITTTIYDNIAGPSLEMKCQKFNILEDSCYSYSFNIENQYHGVIEKFGVISSSQSFTFNTSNLLFGGLKFNTLYRISFLTKYVLIPSDKLKKVLGNMNANAMWILKTLVPVGWKCVDTYYLYDKYVMSLKRNYGYVYGECKVYVFDGTVWSGSYEPVSGDTIVKDDITYTYDGKKWLLEYTPVSGDTIVKDDKTYTYNGIGWFSEVDKTTGETTEYIPVSGDTIVKDGKTYTYGGIKWYDETEGYELAVGDTIVRDKKRTTIDNSIYKSNVLKYTLTDE